jgi:hypothetical protein
MWDYVSHVHPNTAFWSTVIKETSVADGIFDRVPLVLHSCFCLPNLAAFIALKVTKQVTSAHIVQKVQSPVRFMFRVSLPMFLFRQQLTSY